MNLDFDGFQITDEDINWVESLFEDIKFDEARREIIKRLDSFDVQAFPGTGKTTVLVAKLAIMAKKWAWNDIGICVLSHTNAAREEIENRLAKTEIGECLLSHPHYIGTVQSFFDKYVAMPRLRSDGYPITMIDTEISLLKRWDKLGRGTKYYLEKNRKSNSVLKSVNYPPKLGNIGCAETAASYKDAQKVLNDSFKAGYYTFEEMLIIADQALKDSPWLPLPIQKRFPIVFIDEAQDTNDMQWDLINAVFPKSGSSSIQLFGDGNQAIYNFNGEPSNSKRFPEEPILTIADSKRFGKGISMLVDSLATSCNGLEGTNREFDSLSDRNTIFIFDDINKVLPSFASYVMSLFSDEELAENENIGVYAVGAIHNKDVTDINDKHFPVCVKDYWHFYDNSLTNKTQEPRYLIDYFRDGQSSKDAGNLENCYAKGIRKLLNISKTGLIPSHQSAIKALSDAAEDAIIFKEKLLYITNMPFSSYDEWNLLVEKICEMCTTCFGDNSLKHDFLKWKENNLLLEKGGKTIGNIYHYEENGRQLNINIGSIHSVKGRTHLATLVLDTFWYERNIPSIMPWLLRETKKKPGKMNVTRLKTHYVALTRAKALVCIAISKKAVENIDISRLKNSGWRVQEI